MRRMLQQIETAAKFVAAAVTVFVHAAVAVEDVGVAAALA